METSEKLQLLITITNASESDVNILSAYLNLAKTEILNWKYRHVGGIPDGVTDVPAEDENTQIFAVVAGFNMLGAENQNQHTEIGITRRFDYSSMVAYIRANVTSYAGAI